MRMSALGCADIRKTMWWCLGQRIALMIVVTILNVVTRPWQSSASENIGFQYIGSMKYLENMNQSPPSPVYFFTE